MLERCSPGPHVLGLRASQVLYGACNPGLPHSLAGLRHVLLWNSKNVLPPAAGLQLLCGVREPSWAAASLDLNGAPLCGCVQATAAHGHLFLGL